MHKIKLCEKKCMEEIESRIMLVLLPFWTPLFPPLGISCLKSYLKQNGYHARTVDANTEASFWNLYYEYFSILRGYIPEEKRGNFYNIGHEVFRNQMMAYINKSDIKKYYELVKILVSFNFYTEIDDEQVKVLDKVIGCFFQKLESYLINLIEKHKPETIGLSVYTGNIAPSMYAFRIIKEKYPYITTIMGGGVFANQLAEGSQNLDLFMEKTPYIDKYISGEGEILLLRMLQGKLPDNKRFFTLKDINNETLDITSVKVPDFSDINTSVYPQMSSYTSRSCPFECSFCSETVQWGKYRKKSAVQVVNELKELYSSNKCQLFLLGDSLLNPIIDSLSKELIKDEISLYWDGYLRADKHVCNTENTLLWRKAGFYRARLGVESGSQRVLDLMEKHITTEQIKEAVACLAYAGIKTTTYWVVGYPGETEEDFQMTLDLIEEMKDDIYEAECSPFTYFLSGQVSSDKFASEFGIKLLYPESATDMLVTQSWILNSGSVREETYSRVCRLANHCKKLGIPNPYSMEEIFEADMRWKRLHRNAVPPLIEFRAGSDYINENKNVSEILKAENFLEDNEEFDF